MSDVVEAFAATSVVTILRSRDTSRLAAVADTLAEAGLIVIEFALSAPGTLGALRDYSRSRGSSVVLGAGTVLDGETARQAVAAGARYLVAPALCLDVIEEGRRLGVPVLPGAFTPTEVFEAWRAGAAAVKLFPASVGGPSLVEAIRAPLPEIPLVPTGGVGVEDAAQYLAAGAIAVGVGSPLIGDACEGGNLDRLRERASALCEVVATVREAG